jgi:hypothetical protein
MIKFNGSDSNEVILHLVRKIKPLATINDTLRLLLLEGESSKSNETLTIIKYETYVYSNNSNTFNIEKGR